MSETNETTVGMQSQDGSVASEFLQEELVNARKGLKNTQIVGSVLTLGCMVWMFSIAGGFAKNLDPQEAAKITKGMIVQQLDVAQPQISNYLATEIPAFIEGAPDFAKDQLPIYRESLEQTLETEFDKLASDTSSNLDAALDAFLLENQEQLKTIILMGQDKETTDEVATMMRAMFIDYLTLPQDDGESIQLKLDKALVALNEVEVKTWRLAHGHDLDSQEKKLRRAVACLFTTVRDNHDAIPRPDVTGFQNGLAEAMATETIYE